MWQLGMDTSHVPAGHEYPRGCRLEMGWEGQSNGYGMTSLHTVPCNIAGMGHCPTGRENSFQQSNRLAGLVSEGLHPHTVCPKLCPEFHVILCKINEPLHYSIIQS